MSIESGSQPEGINYEQNLAEARQRLEEAKARAQELAGVEVSSDNDSEGGRFLKAVKDVGDAQEAFDRAYYMRNMHKNGLSDDQINDMIGDVMKSEQIARDAAAHRDFERDPI